MTVDLIRYDLLVQDALRGVVRQVLSGTAREGLPGDHHFYISFRTHARGVRLSSRMRDLYPDEMTIILQHQFWDLSVAEQAFEVGLWFQNVPEMLLIPFDAVTRFADPAAGFELKFSVEDEVTETASTKLDTRRMQTVPISNLEISPQAALAPEAGAAKQKENPSGVAETTGEEATATLQGEPKVVSIDAFRKKS
jgi:uncharacterized protein